MFKGIVMEIKDDYVIIMKEDGTLVRIKNKDDLKVGKSIFFFEEDIYIKKETAKVIPFRKYIVPLGAIAALFIILINPIMNMFSAKMNNVYAVLTFDINPSIEFELDQNGIIKDVKGINDDAIELGLDKIKGMTFEEGTVVLKDLLSQNNYLSNNNAVLIGFSFIGNENINYEKDIQKTIQNTFKGTDIAFLKGQKSDLEKAQSQGISLGKYEALVKLDEDNFEDAIENLSTQEMLELLRNVDGSVFLDEDQLEELQDELEDRLEDENDRDDNDDDDNNDENDED
ncbi:Regulation of sigma I protein [uncultured Clostridium sp.]|uniref:anti-sigma factor domain-containing protein n=1 Tax=uncultured Clostridium sp. TaxID=59620 RepID=UPI00082067DE|nr:anti-sigma factor domain-containing protein [uncultured Clostridium sp.]SCK02318.1 Regulation of sigma I protein [uncultured Clostridium sp.]